MSVRVRLFAAAAEAVGHTEVHSTSGTVADLVTELATLGAADAADVLSRCAIMVNGHKADAHDVLPHGATVDVLPPFAGG